MRYTGIVDGDWAITETVLRNRAPSGAWANAQDKDLANRYHELRILAAAGIPINRERGNPQVQHWKKYQHTLAKQTFQVWVLKTKPGRWRLYFFIPQPRVIEIIHAVSKKEDKRDPADFTRCCFVIDRIVAGTASSQYIELPDAR